MGTRQHGEFTPASSRPCHVVRGCGRRTVRKSSVGHGKLPHHLPRLLAWTHRLVLVNRSIQPRQLHTISIVEGL